jgi:ABC-type sugar transport system ATPase subunit
MQPDTVSVGDDRRPIARLQGIQKSYPGVKALKGIDFDIFGGEIHCLVGENGAGKSTLMRVLTGATQPDAGVIEIDGRPTILDPVSRLAHGIGIVHQELDLIPAMSVAENIFLGHEPLLPGGRIDRKALDERTIRLLGNFDLEVSPDTPVRTLAPAEQQLVQIAKALSHDNRILILDEPTASLTDNEVEHLFAQLRRLREQGLGIIYISHRLEEVTALGDRLTVLRDGGHVLTAPVAGISRTDIIHAMVGRPLGEQFPRSSRVTSDVALSVDHLTRRGEFEDISFEVHRGEVLAIAGIVGAGRSELLETVFGLRHADSGAIAIEKRPVEIRSPRAAIRLGLGLVPEERRESGLVLGRSVADNLVYPIIDRLGNWLYFRGGQAREVTDRYVRDLSIKTPSAEVRAGSLSGGNQQKIVIGKWLAAGVRILLLDEPTRGVDVNAKAEIYRLIDELAQSGVAIIVASSELPEVLGISDRVMVIAQGRKTATLKTADTSQVEIMHYAVAANATSHSSASPVGLQ